MVLHTEKNLNFKIFINVLTGLMNDIKLKKLKRCLLWQ